MEFLCFCEDCKKTVPVKKAKITKEGKMLIYLSCGHTTGFVFDAKLVPIEKMQKT